VAALIEQNEIPESARLAKSSAAHPNTSLESPTPDSLLPVSRLDSLTGIANAMDLAIKD